MAEQKLRAAKFSIGANTFLIAIKLGVALYTGSLGVLAEFAHSFFDLLASLFAYIGIKKADEPADETHHYGHERFENVSSLIQTILIAITSLAILWEAYGKWSGGGHEVVGGWVGMLAMFIALGVDYAVAKYLHKTADEHGSPALEADAYHFTTDIWSTLAVIVGLAFAAVGFQIADIAAAVVVALIMLQLSARLGMKAFLVMTDKSPDAETMERVAKIISSHPKVKGYHTLRGRMAGSLALIDVSIHLPSNMSLREAHRIAEELEERVEKGVPFVKEMIVHAEPTSPHDEERAKRKASG
jgi:cation diffusion facilitator family transporter